MGHHKRKRKINRRIVLILVTVIFSLSTVLLAARLPNELAKYKRAKETLSEMNIAYAKGEQELKQVNAHTAKLKEEVQQLEKALKEAQQQNPKLYELEQNNTEVKKAYLTFDDGPSENTVKILDFLKVNHIKATFFVIGSEDDTIYKRIVEEGHTIGVHSDTHRYEEIYKDVDAYMADIGVLSDRIYAATGVRSNILRFPGGSNNAISKRYNQTDLMGELSQHVVKEGYYYFDWNVDSADASAVCPDKDIIVNAVLDGAKNKKNAIILMHDAGAKTTTVEALPEIVEGLKKEGYVFDKITEDTVPIRFK